MTEQTASIENSGNRWDHTFWVLSVVYGLLGPVAAFAKMGTVPLLIILMLAHRNLASLKHTSIVVCTHPFFISLALIILWSVVTFLWSESPDPITLFRLFAVGWMAIAAAVMISRASVKTKERLSTTLVASLSVLIVVLIIEGLTDASLHALLRPEDTAPRDGEWVPYLQLVAARGTAILAPFSFIGATLCIQIFRRPIAGILFLASSILAVSLLPMGASTLAIFCGSISLLAVRWAPKIMTRTLFTGTIGLALATPFLMSYVLTKDRLTEQGIDLTRNQLQRVEIWNYASDLVLEKPVLGYGFAASRYIGSRGDIIPGTNWAALPLHPHNAFLQVWLELGVVGVALLCAMMALFWGYIEKRISTRDDISVVIATFVTTLVISLISFGVWQYWWIATWGLLAGAVQLMKPNTRPN